MVTIRTGSFTKINTVNTQDIPLPSGLPDMTAVADGTWAIIFWTVGNTGASGTWQSHFQAGLGFVTKNTSIQQYTISGASRDAVGTSDSARRMAAKCIAIMNPTDTTGADEAEFVSFLTATTMRLSWTAQNNATAYIICYTIITGLTGAKVVNWQAPTTAIDKAVTGAGFNPDLVFHLSAITGSVPESVGTARFAFGAMNKHGQQFANAFVSEDTSAVAATSRYQQTDACLIQTGSTEVVSYQTHFKSMDADGFTVNFSTVDGAARQIASLCLDGISSKIGAFVTPIVTGVQTVPSRHGFTIRGLLNSTMRAGPQSSPVTAAVWGLGVTDGANHRTVYLHDDDAADPTVAKSVWRNDRPWYAGSSALDYFSGQHSAFTENDFAVDWTTVDTGALEWLYCLLGDAGVNTFPAMVSA